MESTSAQIPENVEKFDEADDAQNVDGNIDLPQRQDFSSESNKIEINNMGKFAFGVSIL